MEPQYLITGAAGHLGSTIVRKLVQEGKAVRALIFPGDRSAEVLPEEVERVSGDVREKQSLGTFFNNPTGRPQILIHCAGIVTIASAYNQSVYDVNVIGTQNILELSKENSISRMIYVSSVHAIPELPKGQTMAEITSFDPDKVFGLYSRTKAIATQLALNAAMDGLNLSVVHPSGICGPYDSGHGYLTQLLIDFYKGKLFAAVKGGYDFVDVRDVANGILNCVERGNSGECYILSNQYYSVPQLLELFHQVTGKKAVNRYLPLSFAKATAPLAERYYKHLNQPPLYTPYSLHVISANANFSHEKATRELGYTTRPMERTVADTVEWLKQANRV